MASFPLCLREGLKELCLANLLGTCEDLFSELLPDSLEDPCVGSSMVVTSLDPLMGHCVDAGLLAWSRPEVAKIFLHEWSRPHVVEVGCLLWSMPVVTGTGADPSGGVLHA